MNLFRHTLAGAAMSGALAFFAAAAPAEAAGEFEVGGLWKGKPYFSGPGNSFSRCDMGATFPEGAVLFFSLDAQGVLSLDLPGPDDMNVPKDKVPLTLSIDGRIVSTAAMDVDDEALDYEELWLFTKLGPAAQYLPAFKNGKSVTVVLQGETMGKPPANKAWSYTVPLAHAAAAFQALESCAAQYAAGGPKTAGSPPAKAPAAAPPKAAGPAGEFQVGNIWKGQASFGGPGNSFSSCGMIAGFPEGLELYFALDTKGVLSLDLPGPDDMNVPKGKAPLTLSIDGRVLRTNSMNVDEDAFMMDEVLWLYTDLSPASDYLPVFKNGKSIKLVLHGETMDKPPLNKAWTYAAALTGAAEAFQALEACVAKHAGTSLPATGSGAAGTAGGATSGATKGSTGVTKKAASFGAIAVGEDDGGLVSGISSNHPSLEAAMAAAVEACEGDDFLASCEVRATMDRGTPCGAIASGRDGDDEPVYGWGTGTIKSEAELGAMQACSGGAFGCQIKLSRCLKD